MTEISVIIPTFNEKENIETIVSRVHSALNNQYNFEIIVVDDDSPDLTWKIANDLKVRFKNLKVLRRIDRKGLSSAVVDGFLIASGEKFAVIDADLQHDHTILPQFVKGLDQFDFVVGSRKVEGGGIDGWSKRRRFVSWSATVLANTLLGTYLNDPMSGFFGIQKKVFDSIVKDINPKGFKILLELIHISKSTSIKEIGYTFKPRIHGESKLDTSVVFDFLYGIISLKFGKLIPTSFVKFSLVGLSGVLVNFIVLKLCKDLFYLSDSSSLLFAIFIAMVSNYFWNNKFTFKENKIIGSYSLFTGFLKFFSISSVGALINYSLSLFLVSKVNMIIYFASFFGILVATVWNYLVNSRFTWKEN